MKPLLRLIVITSLMTIFHPALQAQQTDEKLQAKLQQVDKSIRLRQYSQAVKQLQPLVQQNSAEAQYRLAGLYRSGKGVQRNLDKALDLLRKAAASGLADAQFALAALMEKQADEHANKDILYWYQSAADQGHRKAQKKLKQIRDKTKSGELDPELFFSAIRSDDETKVRRFLDNGIDPGITDERKRNPLMVALLSGHKSMSTMLLPMTVNLDHSDRDGNRSIHFATVKGYTDIVTALVNNKVDINAKDRLGNTALMLATRHGHTDIIKLLLDNRADHRLMNRKEVTAVQIAHNLGQKKVINLLAKYGITLAKRQKPETQIDLKAFRKTIAQSNNLYDGWPALSIASVLGYEEIVDQLLQQGANLKAVDREGFTALHRAASKGHQRIVRKLLGKGAYIDATNKDNETPLFKAAESGHAAIVKYLMAQGCNTSLLTNNHHSALSIAIQNGHKDTVNLLADIKLEPAAVHKALLLATQKKMQALAIRLVRRDKLINNLDDNERNLLWYSADLGLYKLSETLLRDGRINKDQRDKNGYTALARAVVQGHSKLSELLLKFGANANTMTREKNTLLMLAVLSGKTAQTTLLINRGASVNAQNMAGDTALMLAAGKGHDDIIMQLIKAGANLQMRNLDELNAYQVAQEAGHQSSAELIREQSGRIFKMFN